MKRLLMAGWVAVLLAACGCTENNYYSLAPVNTVKVQGMVRGLRCGLYYMQPPGFDCRYSAQTGKPATVKFVAPSGFTFHANTDDSSRYEAVLEPGAYTIVLETPHSWPDTTFSVALISDTVIDFTMVYDYYPRADSIRFYYRYASAADTAGIEQELQWLHYISRVAIGLYHEYQGTRTIDVSQWSGAVTVNYVVPLATGQPAWKVYDEVTHVMDSWLSGYLPGNLYVTLDFYACLDLVEDLRTNHPGESQTLEVIRP